jgi:hypothetical protein
MRHVCSYLERPKFRFPLFASVIARGMHVALGKPEKHTRMLTISAFTLAAGFVLTSVWWACRNEAVPLQPNESQAPNLG